MKFRRIELENIFAYDGRVEFDLSATDGERNIALIWGRNGMGKTSFLRAMKLLFLGMEHPNVRSVGWPPKQLGLRQFVVGDGANWSGLINQPALRRAEAEGRAVSARVRAEWTADDGGQISAEREWTPTTTGAVENVTVFDRGERLTSDPARDRVADLLPPEFVDFFFFDGEQIKELAESDERKEIDFDRLLRITFIKDLEDELSKIYSERSRRDMSEELLEKVTQAEAALVKARGARDLARQRLTTLDEGIVADQDRLRRLQRTRETLSGASSEVQREALEARRTELRGQIEDQLDQLTQRLPKIAPIVANLGLVRTALDAVEQKIAATSTAERSYVDRIAPLLPDWLIEPPASLAIDSAQSLSAYLVDRMVGQLPAAASGGLFASLAPARAERLQEMLSRYMVAGGDLLRVQTAELETLRRSQLEMAEVTDQLMRLEVGSQSDYEQYRAVMAEIADTEERLANSQQAKGQQRDRLDNAEADMKRHEADIATLQESRARAADDRLHAHFISRIGVALSDLRDALRTELRGRLEESINRRFTELAYEHNLVSRITIDERYTLSFVDAENQPIGRASLSSGLKQLAATALMWAMKEVSGFDMPMIIDTPLGRIDRENQENMLRVYYPHLASQVVILPTNAEIDSIKFALIADHVGLQYRIVNETGDRARVETGSLVH